MVAAGPEGTETQVIQLRKVRNSSPWSPGFVLRRKLGLQQGRASNRLERRDRAGDKGRLHLEHGVIDGGAEAFVQDLDAEQLAAGGGAVFVGRGHGDVEGQDLVGVPGQGGFLEALDFGQGDVCPSSVMVALTGTAISWVRVELKTPVAPVVRLKSCWNWGTPV